MRKTQNAPQRLASAEQIANALLNGSYDLENFPELAVSGLTKLVVQEILDRVRTLQQRTIAAEVRADHINTRKPDRRINVEKECQKSLKANTNCTTHTQRLLYIAGFYDAATLIQGNDDNIPQ